MTVTPFGVTGKMDETDKHTNTKEQVTGHKLQAASNKL
jgi:hypothetical protein